MKAIESSFTKQDYEKIFKSKEKLETIDSKNFRNKFNVIKSI